MFYIMDCGYIYFQIAQNFSYSRNRGLNFKELSNPCYGRPRQFRLPPEASTMVILILRSKFQEEFLTSNNILIFHGYFKMLNRSFFHISFGNRNKMRTI